MKCSDCKHLYKLLHNYINEYEAYQHSWCCIATGIAIEITDFEDEEHECDYFSRNYIN